MTKEIILQRTIIDAIVEIHGWGKKLSNAYLSGIPDLLLVLPLGTFIVEIKKLDALPVRDDDPIRFSHPLTEIQNQCLLAIRRAGGSAAWWVVYRTRTEDLIYVGRDKHDIPTKKEFLASCLHRKIGPTGQAWSNILPQVLLWQIRLTSKPSSTSLRKS